MTVGGRIRECRDNSAMTQEQAAGLLGVPRELLSLWETDQRMPSSIQIAELARLYKVNEGYLLGLESMQERQYDEVFFRGSPSAQHFIRAWLDFLERWAEFLSDQGDSTAGRQKPPKRIDEGYLVDARKASKLALEVRAFYDLGEDALPDLYAFLDGLGVLVYRAPLGPLEESEISGAFINHPKLGWCILVNTDITYGRQIFTLAHEFAHALYHYKEQRLVSRRQYASPEEEAQERFANAWAANFLVPGSALRSQVKALAKDAPMDSPYQALQIACHFGVSYATLLYRLLGERLINRETLEEWKGFSALDMASRVGLPTLHYDAPRPLQTIERYPRVVQDRLRHAVANDEVSVAEAAGILDVDGTTIEDTLMRLPDKASQSQIDEFSELKDVVL